MYGHTCAFMYNTCMTFSTCRVIHIYMYSYVAKYKYGHTCTFMCNTCITLSTYRVILASSM